MELKLEKYITQKHKNKPSWFIDEVQTVSNQQRINKINEDKKYLDGEHDVLRTKPFIHNGQVVEPRKVVVNLANQLISWQKSFLLKNSVQVVGDEKVAERVEELNKRAKYDLINNDILKMLLSYGSCGEYLFLEHNKIKSKVLDPSTITPVYDRHKELLCVIEFYVFDRVSYYTIYTEDKVEEWSDTNGRVTLDSSYMSLSGLPIIYTTNSETGRMEGRSNLDDWQNILDTMETILSKYSDAFFTFLNPIPIAIGQELKGGLDKEQVGMGLNMDDGSDFKLVQAKLDSQTFTALYNQLNQTLLDVSATPSVAMGRAEISNVSETSIKMLFSIAEVRAYENEMMMKRGMYDRLEKVRTLLEYQDFKMNDDEYYSLDFIFNYNIPMNNKEVIENLRTLREINAISTESMLENSPYVQDMSMEKERLIQEGMVESSKVD